VEVNLASFLFLQGSRLRTLFLDLTNICSDYLRLPFTFITCQPRVGKALRFRCVSNMTCLLLNP